MTKIFKIIKQFFSNLWNFRSISKFKKINKKLQTEVKNQDKERAQFLHEFRFYLRKYLKRDVSGKYIPITGKNKAEIYSTIMAVHGTRLKELNLTFTEKLEIKL